MEITPAEVHSLREQGEPHLLLDCREPDEHVLAAIDKSLLIPMGELRGRLSELEPHRQARIVVYCHTGRRSLIVTAALRQAGFPDVMSMAGGIERWSREIDPAIPRY